MDHDYEDRIADDIEDEMRGIYEDEYNEQRRKEPSGSNNCGVSWGLVTFIGLATICFQVFSACSGT